MLIAGLGWMFLLQGEYQRIVDSGILEYNNRVAQREDRKQNLEQLEQLSAEFSALEQERLDQLHAVLPVGVDTVALVDQMQDFADVANVSILSIDVVVSGSSDASTSATRASGTKTNSATSSTASALSASNVRTAIISMNVSTPSSSYDDLKQFLTALESFVPLLNLQNLTYAPDTTSFALQLETYYLDTESTQE